MSQPARNVECEKHGANGMAFVCVHVATAIGTNEKVGFFGSEAEGSLPPIAWCNACENWLLANGEEWNEPFQAHADFKPVCSECFELAKNALSDKEFGA